MRRRFLFMLVLCFSIGIASAEYFGVPSWVVVILGLLLLFCMARRKWTIAALCLAGLAGFFRTADWAQSSIRPWQPVLGQMVTVRGVVISADQPTELTDLRGPVRPGIIRIPGLRLAAGRVVAVRCRPEIVADSLWRRLTNRRFIECTQATILNQSARPETVRGWLAAWRAKVSERIIASLRADAGAMAVGLVFGDASRFSDDLRQAFRLTGTTHIVALSGFNISIIVVVLLEGFAPWVGRRSATMATAVVLVVFIVVTGAAASVVRAALMGAAVVLARMAGRPVDPLRPVAFAVVLMLVVNPGLLLHDVGFQLSLSSTLGLILLSAPFETKLAWLAAGYGIRSNVSTTLAATVASFPIMATAFGRLSLVSVAANVVILPLIPLGMAVAALHAVVASYVPLLATVTRPITELLLLAVTSVIRLAAEFPVASVGVPPGALAIGIAISALILVRSLSYASRTTP